MMEEDEINRLADRLAEKLQVRVTDAIYRDAGRNLFAMARKTFWALVVAIAAWNVAKYGNGHP